MKSFDISSITEGRPRDLWSNPLNSNLIENKELKSVIEDEYDCLSIITSTGKLLVLSSKSLLSLDNDKQNDDSKIEYCVLIFNELKGEPRLTAISSWSASGSNIEKMIEKNVTRKNRELNESNDDDPKEKKRRKFNKKDTKIIEKTVSFNDGKRKTKKAKS